MRNLTGSSGRYAALDLWGRQGVHMFIWRAAGDVTAPQRVAIAGSDMTCTFRDIEDSMTALQLV